MADFIDDFLAGLDADKSKPRQSGDYITKLQMNAPDNQGTVAFAPFMDQYRKFYYMIKGVRELRTTCSKYKDGNEESWIKILPKDFYGDLTDEQSALYDEVVGLFDQLDADMGDVDGKWGRIRFRSYSLFQGVLIQQQNRDKVQVKDNLNKAVLFVFPSKSPVDALANAMQTNIATLGNKEWIPAIFAPTDKGREGILAISFSKSANIGYDTSVSFTMNSTFSKLIDPNAGFPEEVTKLFKDPISDFLGWQNGDGSRFDTTMFNELKLNLQVAIKSLKAPAPVTPQPNNNGNDPMLNAPTQAPSESNTTDQGGSVVGGVKLPF